MRKSVLVLFLLMGGLSAPSLAEDVRVADESLIGLLRTQVFNKVFEGFDFYHVTIERDVAHADGTREVTAEAKGKFFEHTRRLKALFQLDGQTIIGGQVLEEEGLPACSASSEQHGSEL